MRLSTILELAGFSLLTYAAFSWIHALGYLVAGVSCLFIGWATDDEAAVISVARVVRPITRGFQARKARRHAKRSR